MAEVARLGMTSGAFVIGAAITPLRAHRALVRERLGDAVTLVHLACPLDVCMARDPRGLYRRALRGELPGFTGVDSAFEEPAPEDGDLSIDTSRIDPEAAVEMMVTALRLE
jgi:adenylylsulfate kinase-like enzyme